MKKNSKGITLVSLVIVIVVMFIIATITVNISFDRFEINNLKKMLSDLELLEDKVNNYYLEYNELPIVSEYTYTNTFVKNSGDNDNYYIINLEALDKGVALNYGKDGFENPNSSDDVYIINEQSHNIYYAKGIKMKENYYYSFIDNSNTDDTIPPSKPEIKIISGTQNEDGIYTTEVKVEIIPGKDKYSGVLNTTYLINDMEEKDIKELENNILTISEDGECSITVKTYDNNNNVSATELVLQLKMPKKIAVGQIVDENCTINGEDYSSSNPVIPEGFMAINTETSSWDAEEGPQVSNGLVISDGVSEFVWIPVTTEITSYGLNTSKYREPDVVTGISPSSTTDSASGKEYDATTTNLNKVGVTEDLNGDGKINAYDFKKQLEDDFSTMVKSVEEYGGFYVGRYEVSYNSKTKKSQSVKNATSANSYDSTSNKWYGLYALCKTYKTGSVTGSMIWGSQWNAMMTFIGNAANTTIDEKNTGRVTGSKETDKINNIYDLYGNSNEWTLEAYSINGRVLRGGNYYNSLLPNYQFSSYAEGANYDYGSRLTLYVEL